MWNPSQWIGNCSQSIELDDARLHVRHSLTGDRSFCFPKPCERSSAQNCLKIEYTLRQFSCVFPVAYSCVQFPAVAFQLHSSCKFYLHWGKHSQAQKLSKQILIRCQVSMIDELANASPNGNRICNWNLQLECNWNATAGNCTEEYVTGKTHAVVVLVKMVLFHYNRIAR